MKKIILVAAVVAACVLNGGAAETVEAKPDGGMVSLNAKGTLAIVNAGGCMDEIAANVAKKLRNFLMIMVEPQRGKWTFDGAAAAFAATKANMAVFVMKDKALPISLIAMEARWGVVNTEGLSAESVEKEIMRVAIVLLGGASSKYPASTMRPAFSAQDLEKVGSLITIDSLMAIFPNLEQSGFKQFEMMSYRDACEEGVEPEPVNEIQRKIRAEFKR